MYKYNIKSLNPDSHEHTVIAQLDMDKDCQREEHLHMRSYSEAHPEDELYTTSEHITRN